MKRWMQGLFIILVTIGFLGLSVEMVSFRYWVTARQEASRMFADLPRESVGTIGEQELAGLPETVQKWLREADTFGRPQSISVRTRVKFSMVWPQREQWREGIAHLYVNTHTPGSVWMGTSKELPFIRLCGKSVFLPEVEEETYPLLSMGRSRILTGATLRQRMMILYLSYLPWIPAAAVNPYLVWEETVPGEVQVSMTMDDVTASGVFFFRDTGLPAVFQATLPYYENDGFTNREMSVTYNRYEDTWGGHTPRIAVLAWVEQGGETGWMAYEHTDSDYNSRALFSSF